MKRAWIFDMDGTLALKHPDRHIFDFDLVGEDLPQTPVIAVVQHLATVAHSILIVTGRNESCRPQTEAWLIQHHIVYEFLFMRTGDHSTRRDDELKRMIYEQHIQPYYEIIGVFEDRLSVIRMWRSLGLWVFDCNNGRGEF